MNCPYDECPENGTLEEIYRHRHKHHGDPLPPFAAQEVGE
jgi:hypothetical protein